MRISLLFYQQLWQSLTFTVDLFCSVVCKELLQVNKNQEIKDNTQDIIRESSKEIQRVSNYTCEDKFKLVSNLWDTGL